MADTPKDYKNIAVTFAHHYYTTFDSNRAALATLYRPHSMLTYSGQEFQGGPAIAEKLVSLPFEQVVHANNDGYFEVHSQPSLNGGILVMVTGLMHVDQDPPMKYCQTFQLMPEGQIWYVFNDIFRTV
ncbi:MAG: Nuclear transport factor 2 [Thelocarpon superellum]|nr:MAG: Nuclear transport factor 2 [Thelocarpon superellum]